MLGSLKKVTVIPLLIWLISCSGLNFSESPSSLPKKLVYSESIKLSSKPVKIIFNDQQNTYITLGKNHSSIDIYNSDGDLLHRINRFGGYTEFSFISDISLDSAYNIFALDRDFNKILKFDEMGQFISSISLSQTKEPELLEVKTNGDFLIYDAFSNEIFCLTNTRQLRYNFGKFELISPVEISSSFGFNYVLDNGTNSIIVFDNFGSLIKKYTPTPEIKALTSTKYFPAFLNSNTKIYLGKQDYFFQTPLINLSENPAIENPYEIFIKNSGLGVVDKNIIHIFQFSKSK